MKLVANLVMALALALGTISAATAYFVPLSKSDAILEGYKLSAPAGVYDPNTTDQAKLEALESRIANIRDAQAQRRLAKEGDQTPLIQRATIDVELPEMPEIATSPTATETVKKSEALRAIAQPGDELDPAMLELLRNPDASEEPIRLVKVNRFRPSVWFTMWQSWVFILSVGLLTGSALVIRRLDAQQHRAEDQAQGAATIGDPLTIVQELDTTVRELAASLPRLPDDNARNHAIVAALGKVQNESVPAFVQTRPVLITRYGLGGFADIMDIFAASERQINRAWSAAADGVQAEAADALDRARAILPALEERVAKKG